MDEYDIRELIKDIMFNEIYNNLKIVVKCDYGGSVSVELKYKNESISFDSDNVTIDTDPEYN